MFGLFKNKKKSIGPAKNVMPSFSMKFVPDGSILPDQVHGMLRSEVLDCDSCAMCMSMDGRVLSLDDPFVRMEKIHDGCRGMWVTILKSDAAKPDPQPLPKEIADRFAMVDGIPRMNMFEQPEKPLFEKDSRLARKIMDGEISIPGVS